MGADGVGDAEATGFAEALFELGDWADFSAQAEFADCEGSGGHGSVGMRRGDGECDGEVGCGFGDFDSAGDVDEDVVGCESEFGAFFEDGDDHCDAVGGDAGDFSSGGADDGACGEGLDLDEENAAAGHGCGDDRATWGRPPPTTAVVLHEEVGGIGDLLEAVAAHAEQADLVGGTEAVFDAADDAMRVVAVALEVDDGVDDVLEELRAGEDALLGDVANEHDGRAGGFGEGDEHHGAFAKLCDRAGGGGDVGLVGHLDRVEDEDVGFEFAGLLADAFEVGFGEDFKFAGG